jgi:hypothetical protein
VAEEVGEFTDDSAVGLVDANQCGADFSHTGLNQTIVTLLPLG